MLKKRKTMSTTQVIVLGFFAAIAVGTLLLWAPFSHSGEVPVTFMDALFTATTSVCVCGLTTVDTYLAWSTLGQVIILLLIQFGGLGIVTFTTSIMLLIGRRVTLRDRLLIEAAFNLDTLSGLVSFLRRVLKWTFATEALGAACFSLKFVPEFGWGVGIWKSVFLSVSAFCNAGIDNFGADSMMPYAGSAWVCIVTMALITLGSVGFIVRWDVCRVAHLVARREIRPRSAAVRLSLHTKIVLVMTALLFAAGTLAVLALEYSNPETIGNMSFGGKLLASAFQAVTVRTAGFCTISQKALRDPTALVCMLLMFIGGSPVGCAGGIKTTTAALVFLAAAATAAGRQDSVIFRRNITADNLRKAVAVAFVSLAAVMLGIFLLLTVNGGDFVDTAYEVISAETTAGLSRDYTRTMNTAGRLIIIVCMYLGRIGPISLAIAFNFKKSRKDVIAYPDGEITVG